MMILDFHNIMHTNTTVALKFNFMSSLLFLFIYAFEILIKKIPKYFILYVWFKIMSTSHRNAMLKLPKNLYKNCSDLIASVGYLLIKP